MNSLSLPLAVASLVGVSCAGSAVPSWLPGVDRRDAHAVRFTVKDMPEASRFLAFVQNYPANLQP